MRKRGNSADWKASVYIIFQFRLQTFYLWMCIDAEHRLHFFCLALAFLRPVEFSFWLSRYDWERYARWGRPGGEAINNNCENSIIKNYNAADESEKRASRRNRKANSDVVSFGFEPLRFRHRAEFSWILFHREAKRRTWNKQKATPRRTQSARQKSNLKYGQRSSRGGGRMSIFCGWARCRARWGIWILSPVSECNSVRAAFTCFIQSFASSSGVNQTLNSVQITKVTQPSATPAQDSSVFRFRRVRR